MQPLKPRIGVLVAGSFGTTASPVPLDLAYNGYRIWRQPQIVLQSSTCSGCTG